MFGLGKRNGYDVDGYLDEVYDNSASENYAQDKRTESGFTFGLGKDNFNDGHIITIYIIFI